MRYLFKFVVLLGVLAGITLISLSKNQNTQKKNALVDGEILEKIFNKKPEVFLDENVLKLSFPRDDFKIVVDTCSVDPFMGPTSWVSFKKGELPGVEAMIMGDIVLLQDEVNPAIDIALKNNIQVTALHNHFFWDEPKLFFMHITGEGDAASLAQGIKEILESNKKIRAASQNLNQVSNNNLAAPEQNAITPNPIEKILTTAGQTKNGMLKIVIGREVQAACGCTMGKNMGVNTSLAFGGTDDNALSDGDFCLLESELQPVIRALREANINIVAIHNHMTLEKPRLLFMHYWGRGKAADLAQGLKSALDKTAVFKKK